MFTVYFKNTVGFFNSNHYNHFFFDLRKTVNYFDRELRNLIFYAIEKIGISLRTKLIYIFPMNLAFGGPQTWRYLKIVGYGPFLANR